MHAVRQTAAAACADQIEGTGTAHCAEYVVFAVAEIVVGDDAVMLQQWASRNIVDAASTAFSTIIRDGDAGEGRIAAVAVADAATGAPGGVTANGAVDDV